MSAKNACENGEANMLEEKGVRSHDFQFRLNEASRAEEKDSSQLRSASFCQ